MAENIRYYPPLFKENAVLLSYRRKTLAEAAKELDISAKQLCKWRKAYEKFVKGSFPGPGHKRVNYTNQKVYELEKKLAESRLRLEILEKGLKFMHQEKQELYGFIH